MSSGNRSLPRPRYSRARRAAIVAACASALTGAAVALPAATFADEADTPPIASIDLAGTIVDVPNPGVPLPDVEADTGHLPVATVTEALGLTLAIDTSPEATDTEPNTTEPNTTEPVTTEPVTSEPAPSLRTGSEPAGPALITTDPAPEPPTTESAGSAPATTEPATEPTWDVPSSSELSVSDPEPAPVPAAPAGDGIRTSSGRSAPAVAAPTRATRVAKARPAAKREVSSRVLEAQAQARTEAPARRQVEPLPAVSTDHAVDTEEVVGTKQVGSETRGGLGLTAPLIDLAPQENADTLNLTARNGPNSATGDWNLLPEALYAVAPLMLAGAAVMTHGRRSARAAAASAAVVGSRRRHASA